VRARGRSGWLRRHRIVTWRHHLPLTARTVGRLRRLHRRARLPHQMGWPPVGGHRLGRHHVRAQRRPPPGMPPLQPLQRRMSLVAETPSPRGQRSRSRPAILHPGPPSARRYWRREWLLRRVRLPAFTRVNAGSHCLSAIWRRARRQDRHRATSSEAGASPYRCTGRPGVLGPVPHAPRAPAAHPAPATGSVCSSRQSLCPQDATCVSPWLPLSIGFGRCTTSPLSCMWRAHPGSARAIPSTDYTTSPLRCMWRASGRSWSRASRAGGRGTRFVRALAGCGLAGR
jgi:hypothetical protein